eukprot:scaffold36901_cov37-Prasinocladus_malaysianus.AAC.2
MMVIDIRTKGVGQIRSHGDQTACHISLARRRKGSFDKAKTTVGRNDKPIVSSISQKSRKAVNISQRNNAANIATNTATYLALLRRPQRTDSRQYNNQLTNHAQLRPQAEWLYLILSAASVAAWASWPVSSLAASSSLTAAPTAPSSTMESRAMSIAARLARADRAASDVRKPSSAWTTAAKAGTAQAATANRALLAWAQRLRRAPEAAMHTVGMR